jgi:dolichol kinase
LSSGAIHRIGGARRRVRHLREAPLHWGDDARGMDARARAHPLLIAEAALLAVLLLVRAAGAAGTVHAGSADYAAAAAVAAAAVALIALANAPLALCWLAAGAPHRYAAVLRDARDPVGVACAAMLPPLLAAPPAAAAQVPAPHAAVMLCCAGAVALLMAAHASPRGVAMIAALVAVAAKREGLLAIDSKQQPVGAGMMTLAAAAAVAAALPLMTDALLRGAPKSFTFAEAFLSAGLLLCALAVAAGSRHQDKLVVPWRHVDAGHEVSRSALLAAVLAAVFLLPLALRIRLAGRYAIKARVRPELVLSSGVLLVVLVTYLHARFAVLGSEPLVFVAGYILLSGAASHFRLALLAYWCVVLVLALFLFPPHSLGVSRNVARKAYHLLAVALFLPALYLDRGFLGFSMAIALVVMLLAEAARVCGGFGRVGAAVSDVTHALVDDRDSGPFVLTHIYLLVGCAWPVWITSATAAAPQHAGVAAASGVLVLGVLDAVASAAGATFGRTRWPNSEKTVEGSLAGSATCAVSALAWAFLTGTLQSPQNAAWICVVAALSAMLEAFTAQIDNLVLPIFFFGLCKTFGIR